MEHSIMEHSIMEHSLPRSVFPDKMLILSGSALKMIAMVIMLIDHIGAHILMYMPAYSSTPLFAVGGKSYTLYRLFRDIGRVAFPLFIFLMIEGFYHTRSRLRYAASLLLFAFISYVPWTYAHTGKLFGYRTQNVYFTLFLGFLGIWAMEAFREKRLLQLLCLFGLLAAAYYLKADYGWRGYVLILLLAFLRGYPASQAFAGCCYLAVPLNEWKAGFAFIYTNLYNGQRGFIKGRWKYLFYAFYPVHLAVLGLLKYQVLHLR